MNLLFAIAFLGYCSNQSVCYIFGEGSWDEGIQSCQRLHPNARMIEEKSEEQGIRHTAEAGTFVFVTLAIRGLHLFQF